MKKTCSIVWILVFFLAFPLAKAEAGTFLLGAKYWYTKWDSGVLDWISQNTVKGLKNLYDWDIHSSTGTGTGFLAGPLLGYQTTDGKWNISFAPMVISNFSQKLNQYAVGLPVGCNTHIDTTRYDYDLAGSYSLSQFKDNYPFLEYCKIFAGYKYQNVKIDENFTVYEPGYPNIVIPNTIKYNVNMPTAGVGVAYPVSDKIAVGMQGGLGWAFINQMKIKSDNSIVYNAEASLSYLPIDKMIIQIGYRYQQWYFSPKYTYAPGDYKDVTYGPSLTLVYTF